uniref:Putative secreted protein n=1 Tax=Anopheles marajoara TaxID=58244 RepID=A0A2M4CCY1_9DIPT
MMMVTIRTHCVCGVVVPLWNLLDATRTSKAYGEREVILHELLMPNPRRSEVHRGFSPPPEPFLKACPPVIVLER